MNNNKYNNDDLLHELPPDLVSLKNKDDGFNVPDNYFANIEDRIMANITAHGLTRSNQLSVKKGSQWRRFFSNRRYIGIAAALITAIVATIWLIKPAAPEIRPMASIDLSEEEIESWLVENIRDFDSKQLAALPESIEPEGPAALNPKNSNAEKDALNDLEPEDIENLLKDMTEEELEAIF